MHDAERRICSEKREKSGKQWRRVEESGEWWANDRQRMEQMAEDSGWWVGRGDW
jgi:hypothetical protein